MKAGQLYRVNLSVPLAHVSAVRAAHGEDGQKALLRDVEARLSTAGFSPVLAVTQDPTDNRLFRGIARFRGPRESVSGLEVLSCEEVDEAPAATQEKLVLDPGLTQDELRTVRLSLTRETNPRRLYGLAHTLAPFFPSAASLLAAKATLQEAQAARNSDELQSANRSRANAAVDAAVESRKFQSKPEALGWLYDTKKRWAPTQTIADLLRSFGWDDAAEGFRRLRAPSFPWASDAKLRALFGERALLPGKVKEAFDAYVAALVVSGKRLPAHVTRDEAKRVAFDLIVGREAEARKAPHAVYDLGRCLLSELGYGVFVVTPATLETLLPAKGDEGFVSPSALQLALANAKPMFSGVSDQRGIVRVVRELEAAKVAPEVLRQHILAKNQLERAERALERQRWVDWFRRAEWQW